MTDSELNIVRKIVDDSNDPIISGLKEIKKILIGNGDVKDSICYKVAQAEDMLNTIKDAGVVDKVKLHEDFIRSFKMSPGWVWIVLSYLLTTGVVVYFNLQHIK